MNSMMNLMIFLSGCFRRRRCWDEFIHSPEVESFGHRMHMERKERHQHQGHDQSKPARAGTHVEELGLFAAASRRGDIRSPMPMWGRCKVICSFHRISMGTGGQIPPLLVMKRMNHKFLVRVNRGGRLVHWNGGWPFSGVFSARRACLRERLSRAGPRTAWGCNPSRGSCVGSRAGGNTNRSSGACTSG